MTYDRIVLQANTHRLTESVFDMTSYFRDGGYDVRPLLADAVASAGCPLDRGLRVTSLARCKRYSSRSIIH